MSRFAAGSMTGAQLIEQFGLRQGGNVGSGFNASAGASDDDRTKANKALGNGYLTNETYNKLKNDSNLKAAYASLNGQEAADKKFRDGGISINTMDALFDDLTKDPGDQAAAAEAAPKPIQLSDRAAEAKAYTGAYDKVMLPRQGDYIIKNDQSVVNDFDAEYKLQLNKAKQPYMADGSDVPNSVQTEATEYANDYKKAVADTLVPKVSF